METKNNLTEQIIDGFCFLIIEFIITLVIYFIVQETLLTSFMLSLILISFTLGGVLILKIINYGAESFYYYKKEAWIEVEKMAAHYISHWLPLSIILITYRFDGIGEPVLLQRLGGGIATIFTLCAFSIILFSKKLKSFFGEIILTSTLLYGLFLLITSF